MFSRRRAATGAWLAKRTPHPKLATPGCTGLAGLALLTVNGRTLRQEATWFPKKHRLGHDRRHSIIAHEAAHGAAMIFEHIGEDIDSGEAFAYLVEWLFVKIQGHIEN